jgi:SnoaL-like domain
MEPKAMTERSSHTIESLEARVRRLEDIEQIRNLKERYAALCDANYDADGIAELFVEDGKWESNIVGTYYGRDQIKEYMGRSPTQLVWAHHFMISPVIHVADDGKTATGKWSILLLGTMKGADPANNQPVILAATYDDTFIKIDGEWKFTTLYVNLEIMTDIREGWAQYPFGRGDGLPSRMTLPSGS